MPPIKERSVIYLGINISGRVEVLCSLARVYNDALDALVVRRHAPAYAEGCGVTRPPRIAPLAGLE